MENFAVKKLLLAAVLISITALPIHAGPPTRKKVIAGPVEVAGNGISGSFCCRSIQPQVNRSRGSPTSVR